MTKPESNSEVTQSEETKEVLELKENMRLAIGEALMVESPYQPFRYMELITATHKYFLANLSQEEGASLNANNPACGAFRDFIDPALELSASRVAKVIPPDYAEFAARAIAVEVSEVMRKQGTPPDKFLFSYCKQCALELIQLEFEEFQKSA